MAEVLAALAVVASVAQLADYGFKLSIKLYNFTEAVSTADKSISGISSDVSLTSTVLKELCQIIENDKSRVVSEGALVATAQTVKDCLVIFAELEGALDKSMAVFGIGGGEKGGKRRVLGEKLKWPFKRERMDLMRCNLDRLKASLTLMLQVLSYARDVSNRNDAKASLAYQQHLIERLARSENEMKQRYLQLQRAIEYERPQPDIISNRNTSVPASTLSIAAIPDATITGSRSIGPNSMSSQDGLNRSTSAQNSQRALPTLQLALMELSLCFRLLVDLLNYHTPRVQQERNLMHITSAHNDLLASLHNVQKHHPTIDRQAPELPEAVENLSSHVRAIMHTSEQNIQLAGSATTVNSASDQARVAEKEELAQNLRGLPPGVEVSFSISTDNEGRPATVERDSIIEHEASLENPRSPPLVPRSIRPRLETAFAMKGFRLRHGSMSQVSERPDILRRSTAKILEHPVPAHELILLPAVSPGSSGKKEVTRPSPGDTVGQTMVEPVTLPQHLQEAQARAEQHIQQQKHMWLEQQNKKRLMMARQEEYLSASGTTIKQNTRDNQRSDEREDRVTSSDEEFVMSLCGLQLDPLERSHRTTPETSSNKNPDDSGPRMPLAQRSSKFSGGRGGRSGFAARGRFGGGAPGFSQSLPPEMKEGAESDQEENEEEARDNSTVLEDLLAEWTNISTEMST